jgi:hypothetical protein
MDVTFCDLCMFFLWRTSRYVMGFTSSNFGLPCGADISYHRLSFLLQTFPFTFYELLQQALPFYNMLKHQVRKAVGSVEPHLPDPPLPVPANKKILVWVGDELLPRDSAKVCRQ